MRLVFWDAIETNKTSLWFLPICWKIGICYFIGKDIFIEPISQLNTNRSVLPAHMKLYFFSWPLALTNVGQVSFYRYTCCDFYQYRQTGSVNATMRSFHPIVGVACDIALHRLKCGGLSFGVIEKGSFINSLRPRQNRRRFADDIFNCFSVIENIWIPIKISLKFDPRGPINSIPALVQIMAWRRPGDKPLSEPMLNNLPTHICVLRPQWVNSSPPSATHRRQ